MESVNAVQKLPARPVLARRAGDAALSVADRVRRAVDGWDVLLLSSWVLLFFGLAYTWHIGIASIVMGALSLVGGIAGARGEELKALAALIEAKKRGG